MISKSPGHGKAGAYLSALAGALLSLRIEGQPVPGARPRVTRWGTFYPKAYATFLTDCHQHLAPHAGVAPEGPLAVWVEVVSTPPKKTVLSAPRGDTDNFAKGPLDGATKAKVWKDDSLVHTLLVTKRWAGPDEPPHTTLHIAPLG